MAFSELGDSQGSFSYITPSSDLDIDHATLGKLLTEAHRGQADYSDPEGVSVSQSVCRLCLLCSIVQGNLWKKEMSINQLVLVSRKTPKLKKWSIDQGNLWEKEMSISQLFLVSRETRTVLTASFLKTPKLRKWSMDQGNLRSETAQTHRLGLYWMNRAGYCEKIGHHELQAARAEEERRILREELWRPQMDFREVHQQSLTEMEEVRKIQSSTFDTIARRKLIEDQNTILELSGRVQELQNEVNCMNDSEDFQDAESVRSGSSHVTSRPMSFPTHPIPEGL